MWWRLVGALGPFFEEVGWRVAEGMRAFGASLRCMRPWWG